MVESLRDDIDQTIGCGDLAKVEAMMVTAEHALARPGAETTLGGVVHGLKRYADALRRSEAMHLLVDGEKQR